MKILSFLAMGLTLEFVLCLHWIELNCRSEFVCNLDDVYHFFFFMVMCTNRDVVLILSTNRMFSAPKTHVHAISNMQNKCSMRKMNNRVCIHCCFTFNSTCEKVNNSCFIYIEKNKRIIASQSSIICKVYDYYCSYRICLSYNHVHVCEILYKVNTNKQTVISYCYHHFDWLY